MLGFDDYDPGGITATPYRWLRLSWPGAAANRSGFTEVSFKVGGVDYPPAMTATDAPAPYRADALISDVFISSYVNPAPWFAFDDGANAWDYDGGSASSTTTNFLQIDFGPNLRICPDTIIITSHPTTVGILSPFTLLGGNEGPNSWNAFTVMTVIPHPGTSWGAGTTRTFVTNLPGIAKIV
ncbi:hypothetical protein [Azospirillum endophyticum]